MAFKDWSYEQAHRKASEALVATTQSYSDTPETLRLLTEAEECGRIALDLADNMRQIILSTGFLQTVYSMRLLVERGYTLDQLRENR